MAVNLFEPDTLLASQYAALHESRQPSPEKRLLLAVLKSALLDFQEAARLHDAFDNKGSRELHAWFFASDPSWPLSFENLCQQLDLDADYIRSGLILLANG